ncbi:VRR-NUC domain-containing protein [Acetobacter sp. DmW_136]|uniref:VRR-NUC domain-containing protein n=1 Tax=Acetobacter sp. DmW_136 TaxID=2591091 RepID=UPI001238ECC9|nr:VRR-NUC domain-containing protein [Acetobacter sp. DmW_136]KAA8387634.1 VRR-NUC domain-containing protein [Acetobacter sp. DmW_136]
MAQHEEDKLHTFIWKALQFMLPDDAVAWSNENRQCGPREGFRRKQRGCVPGVPDMVVNWKGRPLYIEIKTPKGTISKVQRDMHKRLKATGAPVAVCRSLEDVMYFLETHDVPLKAAVMA